jgi:hypothetical protein
MDRCLIYLQLMTHARTMKEHDNSSFISKEFSHHEDFKLWSVNDCCQGGSMKIAQDFKYHTNFKLQEQNLILLCMHQSV